MSEIIFVVEAGAGRRFLGARALGRVDIYGRPETAEQLHANVRDAVRCHFGDSDAPKIIRLHFCAG